MFLLTTDQLEYSVDNLDGLRKAAAELERVVLQNAPNRHLGIRAISLEDHPGLGHDQMAELVALHGTDRYDPNRRGVAHEFYSQFGVELHLLPCRTGDRLTSTHCSDIPVFEDILLDFVEGPPADRGYEMGLRIDLVMIYDLDQLQPVTLSDDEDQKEPCEYRFRNPDHRSAGLLGIIKVLGPTPA